MYSLLYRKGLKNEELENNFEISKIMNEILQRKNNSSIFHTLSF